MEVCPAHQIILMLKIDKILSQKVFAFALVTQEFSRILTLQYRQNLQVSQMISLRGFVPLN